MAEEGFRAMKAYSRGAFVTVENDRDLRKGAVACVPQGNDLCVRRRQVSDRTRQHILEVGPLGHFLGQWLFVRRLDDQRAFTHIVGHAERHSAATSNHVDTAVARDAEQPWSNGFALVELAEVRKELHERLLGNIGGVVRAAEHAQTEVVERTLVPTHKSLERGRISVSGREDLQALKRERVCLD